MKKALALVALALAGCTPPKQADLPKAGGSLAPFRIHVYPMVAMPGGTVIITCYVPEDNPALYVRIALDPVSASVRANDRIQQRLMVDHLPCGTWEASCTLFPSQDRRTVTLEVRGGLCDGE